MKLGVHLPTPPKPPRTLLGSAGFPDVFRDGVRPCSVKHHWLRLRDDQGSGSSRSRAPLILTVSDGQELKR